MEKGGARQIISSTGSGDQRARVEFRELGRNLCRINSGCGVVSPRLSKTLRRRRCIVRRGQQQLYSTRFTQQLSMRHDPG